MTKFTNSYKKAITVLPNQKKMGSLSFYLNMYADPENGYSLDADKTKQWNQQKISYTNLTE